MMTVKEVSRRTGVSVRALQYYDHIGLLKPAAYTNAGYRLYDHAALEQLQQILLYRELEFPLKDIRRILNSPDFDKAKALEQQIALLELKKEHLEKLIALAHGIKLTGGTHMDFSAFDSAKLDDYAKQANASWGHTPAYREFEAKHQGCTSADEGAMAQGLMAIFAEMGQIKTEAPESAAAQTLVRKLQDYITKHYYTCTKPILMGLGQMYAAGGEFTENIDTAGGAGTAVFANAAIQIFST